LALSWFCFPKRHAQFGRASEARQERMMKSIPAITTVARLNARLHQQVLEVATLHLALDIQRNRIALTLPDLVWPDHRHALPAIRLRTLANRMAH
jgi:hypothetical protein